MSGHGDVLNLLGNLEQVLSQATGVIFSLSGLVYLIIFFRGVAGFPFVSLKAVWEGEIRGIPPHEQVHLVFNWRDRGLYLQGSCE